MSTAVDEELDGAQGEENKLQHRKENSKTKSNLLKTCSSSITNKLETYFFWHGTIICRKPGWAIFCCLFVTGICSLGLLKFTFENRPFKLWIPQESDFIQIFDWQKDNFPQRFRVHMAIFEADNVLENVVLQEMHQVHAAIRNISSNGTYFHDVCFKIPKVADLPLTGIGGGLSWVTSLFRQDYCSVLEELELECLENNILELWGYSKAIEDLSQEQIITDVNEIKKSAVLGFSMNSSTFLGDIEYSSDGLIIGAKAAKHIWITEINYTSIAESGAIDDGGTGMRVDPESFGWEKEFISTMLNISATLNNSKLYFMSSSSFGEISEVTIKSDASFLAIGFIIVFVYVQIMLGKFNCVECRPLLSFMGIICVYLSVIVSYGICSVCGIPFGPVNNVLPFLLLGLGIDDMFVIMQSWNTLTQEEKQMSMHTKMGLALKHAGVSITITSVTDFMAFAIGCTTVLPALRSFCLYAAVGIITVYFFQATFFVAWFSLDQRRLQSQRQGLCWCIKLKNWHPNQCSQRDLCQSFFKNIYSPFLCNKLVKSFVLIGTCGLLAVCGWGFSNLRQEFNPVWFLPQNSYLFKFFEKLDEKFPGFGDDAVIIFSNISLNDELSKVDQLVENLRSNKFVGDVDTWYDSYKQYWQSLDVDVLGDPISDEDFQYDLGEFLFSPSGSKYRYQNFKFNEDMNCINPIAHVDVSTFDFRYKILDTSSDRIEAMDSVKQMIQDLNFTGSVWAWARIYSGWETDKIIEVELYRNLGMAIIVVFILTLLLITSITTSFLVLLCVLFTLIDVMALMQWWGLTIDTVSCIDLVLAVGLCVDYAAHVGHTFMTQKGTRNQRMRSTLTKIGPAVLNGGFSTFLAFLLLAVSDSHVFKTFFKVFFGVTLFGLYHGLVFLPVMLSLVGPPSYEDTPDGATSTELQVLSDNNHDKPNGIVEES